MPKRCDPASVTDGAPPTPVVSLSPRQLTRGGLQLDLPRSPLPHVLALQWVVVGFVVLRFLIQKRESALFFITGLIRTKIRLEAGFSVSATVSWIRAVGAICLQTGHPTVGSVQP